GWGLAWYPDRSAALVKEALDWRASGYSKFLESYARLQSAIYIAHVRHRSTGGPPTYADTHPFDRELDGRHFCFAHNGTIRDYAELPLGRHQPLGGTDSERLFCHLLALMESRQSDLKAPDDWAWLHDSLQRLNERGTINCLLSDGRRLFCYHDQTAWKGLSYRQLRFNQGDEHRLEDSTLGLEIDSDVYNSGYVIATCPLSESGWTSFVPGQLLVLEQGSVVLSTHAPPPC
ncbi:MAG: class II glutamine amidotransferase, partial [Planctomycetaceae bacterium]|nr:class II glutamine amidotransferase [Planctomycetaceae bacterium]